MNKKCNGCGVTLQSLNSNDLGYIKEQNLEKSSLCERCFRIRNYGDYKIVVKDNKEYVNILKNVNATGDLVVLVVDVFNISEELNNISNVLSNPIILVLSKRDILPKDVYEQKILAYMNKYPLNIVDKLLISSNKNYNLDELLDIIIKHKKSSKVYVVGYSNSGKSTLINKMLYNYSDNNTVITTSMLPSTTLDTIEIELTKELVLVDTPGLLNKDSIINLVDSNDLKKIVPTKEIKPITYQIKKRQTIIIDKYAYLDCKEPTNITLFLSEKLNIERSYHPMDFKNFVKHSLLVKEGQDIVINGLCFIKISKNTNVDVYTLNGVSSYLRDSLI